MIINIQLEDLEPEFIPYFRFRSIGNLSLDYATNAIHGYLGDKEVIVFRFKDYGFIHDNRFNTYSISYGQAGIMIEIKKTTDTSLSPDEKIDSSKSSLEAVKRTQN